MEKTTTDSQNLNRNGDRLNLAPSSLSRHFESVTNTKNEPILHVLQWNVLAQAFSYTKNNFVRVKDESVLYESRKWRILEQIVINQPDLCSLEEMDIYECFLKDELPKYGYTCFFTPKINSKCFDFSHNQDGFKGPDGTLLCYKTNLFREISRRQCQLPDDGRLGKEMFAILELEHIPTSVSMIFIGTHLKSKKAFVHSRANQAEALVQFLTENYAGRSHIIVVGDFNGSMDEPFYSKIFNYGLRSSYRVLMNDHEPDFTVWKFKLRNHVDTEEIGSVDYIFYKPEGFTPVALLKLPTKEEIGSNGLPSDNYPSDHLALETKFIICQNSASIS